MKLEKCPECGLYYDRHERGECPYCKPDYWPMVYAVGSSIALIALCLLILNPVLLSKRRVFGKKNYYDLPMPDFRFHSAYNRYVAVHYEGLGAWELKSENVDDAIKEAAELDSYDLVETSTAGNGHFYADDVIAYYRAKDGIYVFALL